MTPETRPEAPRERRIRRTGPAAAAAARQALLTLGGALAAVGLGVGALLHAASVRGLDLALIAAAEAHALPHAPEEGAGELDVRRVPVHFLAELPDDHGLAALAAPALGLQEPYLTTVAGVRYAVRDAASLGVVDEGAAPAWRLVIAQSPAVRLADTALPFGLIYLLVAASVAAGAAAILKARLAAALSPLGEAAQAVDRVLAAADRAHLPEAAPDEVAGLLDAVDDLLGRLGDAARARERFTAYAAHELRTQVAVLRGEAELALRRPRTPEGYRETLTAVASSAARLGELVDGLVLLTRVDGGQAEQGREREHLSAIVHQALRAEASGLHGAAVEDPLVDVHGPLLVAAVANLLRNLGRHAPGCAAQVTVEAIDDAAWVRVDDDGPGLPDPLVRDGPALHAAAAASPGGLGLALTAEIARRHGGALVLAPGPGGHAALRLPRALS